jgi:hypothetical protein
VVGRQAQLQHRVVATEDTGQGLGGETAGQLEAVAGGQLRGQLAALLQSDGHGAVLIARMQQVVLSQEAGEEQPVPVLIGHGLGQVGDGLGIVALVQPITQGTPSGAQPVAKLALVHRHVAAILPLMDGEVLQGGPSGGLCHLAGLQRDVGQELALVLGQGGGHGLIGLRSAPPRPR